MPIEINTDFYGELAAWQLERFGTYTRPMYVRLDPDGNEAKWNVYFKRSDQEQLQALEDFLQGGAGQYTGSGDSWLQFIGLALLGGLFTLVMPCTYPMIPLTVNFFSKQAAAGKRIMPLAFAYSFGILASFTLLGVIVGVLLEKAITNISGDPWVNLVIGILFLLLGLSLLGVFFLRLPSSISAKIGGGQAGYIGALLMGFHLRSDRIYVHSTICWCGSGRRSAKWRRPAASNWDGYLCLGHCRAIFLFIDESTFIGALAQCRIVDE